MPPADNSPGTLWIVATPIGTLGDFSPRAVEVLREVDILLAEDTRRVRNLLSHFHVPPAGRLRSLHEHNEGRKVPELVASLQAGQSVALVSDAGTPVLSDPGFVLVRAVRKANLQVSSVPGPSSFTAALAASGQPPLPATLCGFLPSRTGPRRRRIEELAACPWTVVILMSPHRLARELADLAEILGADRPGSLMAEISKRYERAQVATLAELAGGAEAQKPRGEYILVIAPPESTRCDGPGPAPSDIQRVYGEAVDRGLERREALKETARQLGLRRREVFDALTEKDDEEPVGV